MIYLITNDDGIEADGLKVLVEAAAARCAADGSGQVVVVAPAEQLSECGHRVTTGKALRVERRAAGRYAVQGTPADCVRVALLEILPGMGVAVNAHCEAPKGECGDSTVGREDVCVLSGVNESGNLGVDVYISGTVAAAREAAIWGVRAAAISQYRRRGAAGKIIDADWGRARVMTERVLEWIAAGAARGRELKHGEFWNVNLPAVDGKLEVDSKKLEAGGGKLEEPRIVVCERSREPLPVKYAREGEQLRYLTGRYHGRRREAGSDVEVCFGGGISVTVERV